MACPRACQRTQRQPPIFSFFCTAFWATVYHHVSPKTGPLAGFGEADGFILEQVRGILSKGLENGGKTYKVEIISKDSQSSGSRAAEVASELILGDKVNLIVASATPDTTNPVSDQAEVNEVPCITTNCPWQPYFFGRKGDPNKGFTWTYHFFWGLEDVIASFLALWDELPTNKVVGGLFPNDADGNAWGDPKLGLPPALTNAGYKLHDPGRYQLMLWAPKGLWGMIAERLGWQALPLQRHLMFEKEAEGKQ